MRAISPPCRSASSRGGRAARVAPSRRRAPPCRAGPGRVAFAVSIGVASGRGKFVSPDRKTGEALLHFTELSGRRVEVRLTDAGFESLAFSVAALEKARRG